MKEKEILIDTIIEGLQEKKAKNIIVADMSDIEGAAFEYFVICEGNSTTHVSSITDSMMKFVRENKNTKPFGYDGLNNCQWVAVDYGNVLVHVFLPEIREFYKLEQLWADSVLTQIPDLD